MTTRSDTQEWERQWWSDCANTFGEEAKQITYAHRMGLVNEPRAGKWPVYDLDGKSVVDLGGGPVSMLLKCVNVGVGVIVDPCPYPQWVRDRYLEMGLLSLQEEAETFQATDRFDEAWIYNVLQHVVDPERVIETAKRYAGRIRIFDWLETPAAPGHPHTLHAHELNKWLGGAGSVDHVNENGAVGLAYYGVFDG